MKEVCKHLVAVLEEQMAKNHLAQQVHAQGKIMGVHKWDFRG